MLDKRCASPHPSSGNGGTRRLVGVSMTGGRNSLAGYKPGRGYCEMLGRSGAPAAHAEEVRRRLSRMSLAQLRRRGLDSERELYSLGITFTVYSDRDAIDRVLPFDVIPRTLGPDDWRQIDTGVQQRVRAINLFLHDVYHRQKILKDGVVPVAALE